MRRLLPLLALLLFAPRTSHACQRFDPVVPEDIVAQADLIVRATAVDASRDPAPNVRFRVDEVVKGRHSPTELALRGYAVNSDDFNDRPVPYDFVRKGGRSGDCVASTYKTGAQYLLMLKLQHGEYTTEWYGLGPTNEQLHDDRDPWLEWTRAQAKKK
jgi:hypothetical protein